MWLEGKEIDLRVIQVDPDSSSWIVTCNDFFSGFLYELFKTVVIPQSEQYYKVTSNDCMD